MTMDEVIAVLGVAPGDYRAQDGEVMATNLPSCPWDQVIVFPRRSVLSGWFERGITNTCGPNVTCYEWVSDSGLVTVGFRNNKVVLTMTARFIRPQTLVEKIRSFVWATGS
jgi:hypothetical protein